MSKTLPPIAPGAQIELRDVVWRVIRTDYTSNGKQAWRCVGVSELVRDQEALFLEELESSEVRVLDPRQTELVRDTSQKHQAGLLYIESLLRDVPPPDDALYIGHKAAMDAIAFQLDPAWMALQRPRQRILIADTVGLGKTLEAGILLSELIRRGRARRILVCTTKAMLTQFQKEMWARFTIPLVRLDSIGLQRIRAEIPSHHTPFYVYDRAIISIDTLKQNNWFRSHVEKAHWDVIVIDEAHNVATRGSRDSQRARIANLVSRNCDSLILLSATPHDGKAESFASLMNMLDPTAIVDPSNYTKDDIEGLYVRRFKSDVADQLATRIPERTIHSVHAEASPEEERAFTLLSELSLPHLDARATGDILFKTGLEKALFSSPAACLEQLRSPLRRKAVSDALPDASRKALLDRAQTTASQALLRAAELLGDAPLADDLRALHELAVALEAIHPGAFSKYQRLKAVLKETSWSPRKKDDRLVIFTERRETLRFLAEHLPADLELREGQWEELHGGLADVEQQRIVEDFGKVSAKVRVLIASDVASEGLNLHYLSHRMVHFDVPWSLMVFQQRNGRIDRYGQQRAPQIVYLLTESQNTKIRGDTRILELLIGKDAQAQKNIGDPSAFMNQYDVEAEETLTAKAMQESDAETFEADLDANFDDPFARLLEEGASPDLDEPVTGELPSLFASDLDYLAAGLDRLAQTHDVTGEVRRDERLVELHWPPDLERRYRRLPREIRPKDGVLLLTADPERMQRALTDARKQESAWPEHQLLWANSPILQWLGDRMRAEFGRHCAPVLVVPQLGDPSARVFVVSGLWTSRRGHPLVHRWYAARFQGSSLDRIEPFPDFAAACGLGRQPLPNAGEAVDTDALAAQLPAAVDAVRARLLEDRRHFEARLAPRLAEELARLEALQPRQLEFVALRYAGRADRRAQESRDREQRNVQTMFREHQRWVRESMSMAEEPFLQVVAALVGNAS